MNKLIFASVDYLLDLYFHFLVIKASLLLRELNGFKGDKDNTYYTFEMV